MTDQMLGLFKLAANGCGTKTGVLPGIWDGLCPAGSTTPVLHSMADIGILVANVVRILLSVAGGLAVIFLIVAAIYYVTSTGEAGRVKRAKDIAINSIVGLVIILTAYTVVTYIAGHF